MDCDSRETEKLRRSFKPQKVKILFIGESAPRSGRFFYRDSAMTVFTMQAFEEAFGKPFKSTPEFLRFFKTQGCYLDDLSLVPVDGMPPDLRERALAASVPALARRICKPAPGVVVVVLKKIERHVRGALAQAGIDVPTYVLPFPGHGHQPEYIAGLYRILQQHLRSTRD